MIKRLIALPILALCLTCEDAYTPETTGTLSGSVYPPESGALIRLSQEELIDSLQVNDDGTFRIEEVPAGNYWVEIAADGYGKWLNKNVAVEAGEVTYLGRIHLWSTPWPIRTFDPGRGKVMDPYYLQIVIESKEGLDHGTVSSAFQITPPLDNMAFSFRPIGGGDRITVNGDFLFGQEYTYSLGRELRTIFDDTLDFPLEVSFTTIKAAITEVSYPDYRMDVLRITFNAPVVPDSLLDFITAAPETEIVFSSSRGRQRNNQSEVIGIALRPDPAWRPGTTTGVTLAAGMPFADGSLLDQDTTLVFTIDSLAVLSTYPTDGATYQSLTRSLSIRFNSIIADTTVPGAISISPAIDYRLQIQTSTSGYTNSAYIYPDSSWTENTTYTVTIDTTLTDWYGSRMAAPYEFIFTTE